MLSFFDKSALAISVLAASTCLVAAYPPIIAPSTGSLDVTDANTTLTVIDPQFSIRPLYWGPKIPALISLMNAVNAMANMALLNSNEPMMDTSFQLAGINDNVITALPTNWQKGGQMLRKFAIWGVIRAVYDMTSKGKYQCSTFHLLWQGKEVGTISFSKGILAAPQLSASTAKDHQSQGLLSLDNHIAVRNSSLQIQEYTANLSLSTIVSIDVESKTQILPVNDVFMVILGALGDLAAFPNKDESVFHFSSNVDPTPAFVSFSTWELRPRTQPPFMTYRHIVETLAILPSIMRSRARFSEVDVVLKLNGAGAGVGLLRKLHSSQGSGLRTANVTVA